VWNLSPETEVEGVLRTSTEENIWTYERVVRQVEEEEEEEEEAGQVSHSQVVKGPVCKVLRNANEARGVMFVMSWKYNILV
jgi:hypothetical protein